MEFDSLNQSDWQNFIYLLLLLAFLLSGLVFNKSLDYKKIFKYLGAWALVAFIIIALYAYRFEFADFKNRISGEINPSKAQFNNHGQMTINISQDGHFYLNTIINGQKIRFMIDTGASDITLSMADAIRIGVNPKKLLFNKVYQTANGKILGASIVLESIEIGDVKLQNISASVNNSDMGTSLLGMGFLRKFEKYEFFQDRLIITY